jgi:phosphonatase-like hydrolase
MLTETMKAQGIQLVVCDMAGTTIRDEHEVEACFVKAALATHLHMTEEEILAVQGWSKRSVFEVFWERQLGRKDDAWQNQVELSYTLFKAILETHYRNTPVYATEGCIELFAFLKEKKIPVALTTGFYRKVANIILDKLGWLQALNKQYVGHDGTTIQASIASDEVGPGRPAPDMILKAMQLLGIKDPKNVLNIGDTPSDIQSGKNAGCRYSFCVTNGTHSAAQLEAAEPDKAFASLKAFKAWLKETA